MWPNPQETADLVTFTEEILDGELYVSCSSHICECSDTIVNVQNVLTLKKETLAQTLFCEFRTHILCNSSRWLLMIQFIFKGFEHYQGSFMSEME